VARCACHKRTFGVHRDDLACADRQPQAHDLKVEGSNPSPAISFTKSVSMTAPIAWRENQRSVYAHFLVRICPQRIDSRQLLLQ
jgi:hypothetical protein